MNFNSEFNVWTLENVCIFKKKKYLYNYNKILFSSHFWVVIGAYDGFWFSVDLIWMTKAISVGTLYRSTYRSFNASITLMARYLGGLAWWLLLLLRLAVWLASWRYHVNVWWLWLHRPTNICINQQWISSQINETESKHKLGGHNFGDHSAIRFWSHVHKFRSCE